MKSTKRLRWIESTMTKDVYYGFNKGDVEVTQCMDKDGNLRELTLKPIKKGQFQVIEKS